eukprot:2337105-Prymnesium_polylepis.1
MLKAVKGLGTMNAQKPRAKSPAKGGSGTPRGKKRDKTPPRAPSPRGGKSAEAPPAAAKPTPLVADANALAPAKA